MLQAVLEFINNWFEKDVFAGTFTISEGALQSNPGLLHGQYYRIKGSVFNDGLHQWQVDCLLSETFTGEIIGLAIPRKVIDLAAQIEDWCAENQKVVDGPYESESFGGYSYKLQTGSDAVQYSGADLWKAHFRNQLNAWRKI